jgi:hypothetical protein
VFQTVSEGNIGQSVPGTVVPAAFTALRGVSALGATRERTGGAAAMCAA